MAKQKTPQQAATSQVDAALAPILAEIQSRAARTSQNLGGIYDAVAQAQAPVAGEISQDYQQFGNLVAGTSKGYSDGLRAALGSAADESNQILAQQGSPQQVASGSGAADVLFGRTGSIPVQQLASEGAAFTAAARQLPGQARTLGAQAQQGLAFDVEEQIRKLESERPGMIDKAVAEIRAAQQADRDFRLKQAVAESEFGIKQERLGLERERVSLAWAGLKFKSQQAKAKAQKAAAEGSQPDATLSKVYGYVVDSNGVPITANGKRIPVAKSKGKGVSESSKSVILGRAQSAGVKSLDKLTDGIWNRLEAKIEDDAKLKATYQRDLRNYWGTAMAQVRRAIGPHLKAIGYTQKQIRAEARRIVSAVISPPKGK